MDATPAWIAAGVGLVGSAITGIVAYVRSITESKVLIGVLQKRVDELGGGADDYSDAIAESERRTGEGLAAMRHAIGETNDKIYRTEIWVRDNHVHKEDFREIVGGINRNIDTLRSSIEASRSQMNDKLDRMKESLEEKIDAIRAPDQRR